MNLVLTRDDTVGFSNARKILYTSNKTIHSYEQVSDEIIWSIIIKHLPILQKEIEKLLSE